MTGITSGVYSDYKKRGSGSDRRIFKAGKFLRMMEKTWIENNREVQRATLLSSPGDKMYAI
jgi:hypothetical protein